MAVVTWIPFSPTKLTDKAKARLAEVAAKLEHVAIDPDPVQRNVAIERLRQSEVRRLGALRPPINQQTLASVHVLFDLTKQGWSIRVGGDNIDIGRPTNPLDPEEDRIRIRRQLHAERDEQLRQDSVRAFIKSMESPRYFNGRMHNIFSLLRDGRHLAARLRQREEGIQPYLQFVRGEERCEQTGLRLVDIWRYFRHTWATPYKSVPGRTMMIIVRDRACDFHPVVGIAALSSATVGLAVRDEFIGWTYKQVAEKLNAEPTAKHAKWMLRIVEDAIRDIYTDDLLAEQIITLNDLKKPSADVIKKLIDESRDHRREHYRFMQGTDYKDIEEAEQADDEHWETQAKSLLFRSKRQQELANLLQIRISLNTSLGDKPTVARLKKFLASKEGRVALSKLIRKAKADRVGTVIADLTICGAVPPYNELLGGKLVAMLIASPEVVGEYSRRYRKTPSIIASSMAGRAVVRPSDLVFISTTSLYGRRPNQYDRIAIPTDKVGVGNGAVRYEYLGRTKGIGTFQFSNDAVEGMATLLAQSSRGQRVNSVFGEGTNPRLRKIRDGLDELGLPTSILLDHGAPRLVYGVSLIRNLGDFLLGIDKSPDYILPMKKPQETTARIGRWWYERWGEPRISKDGLLDAVEAHTLVYPIQHGAKVKLPPSLSEEPYLFEE